jgi:hypothetical protein
MKIRSMGLNKSLSSTCVMGRENLLIRNPFKPLASLS